MTPGNDPLADLLREALPDEMPITPDTRTLADRVWHVHRRRRTVRRSAGAVGVTAAALSIVLYVATPGSDDSRFRQVVVQPGATPATEVVPSQSIRDQGTQATGSNAVQADTWRSELARLRAEADTHATIARHLLAARKDLSARLPAITGRLDPVDAVERELDAAALTLVQQADRMSGNNQLIGVAKDWYRRTIERFPDTHAATMARDRLAHLSGEDGGAGSGGPGVEDPLDNANVPNHSG